MFEADSRGVFSDFNSDVTGKVNMCGKTVTKHRQELVDKGYVHVTQKSQIGPNGGEYQHEPPVITLTGRGGSID